MQATFEGMCVWSVTDEDGSEFSVNRFPNGPDLFGSCSCGAVYDRRMAAPQQCVHMSAVDAQVTVGIENRKAA